MISKLTIRNEYKTMIRLLVIVIVAAELTRSTNHSEEREIEELINEALQEAFEMSKNLA